MKRGQRYGLRDGFFYAVSQGGGESYLSAFALVFHATPFQIGLLSAIPQTLGVWAQFLSVWLLHRFQTRRPIILVGIVAQMLTWAPLLVLPCVFPTYGPWLVIGGAVAYFTMGHIIIPAWNSLMTDLVHSHQWGTYFSRRARVITLTQFLALVGGGMLLHWAEGQGRPFVGFGVLFLLAAGARAASALILSRVDEHVVPALPKLDISLLPSRQWIHNANFSRFLMFSGLFHAAVLIAGPYFVIYLLQDLQWSYLDYTAWLAAGVLGQILMLPFWGRLSDRYGNKALIRWCGLFVPVLPIVYLFHTGVFYLVVVNFFGGVLWSGMSLGLQNFVFHAVPRDERAMGVAVWNTANALGWFVGAMAGSWLAVVLPSHAVIPFLDISLKGSLPLVFLVSGLLRVVVLWGFLGKFTEPPTQAVRQAA